MNPRRRELLQWLLGAGSGALLSACSKRTRARPPRVVVVGGGYGGATCARYLTLLDPHTDVVLVEPKRRFITCPFSNLYLGGLRSFDSLVRPYDALRRNHAVRLVHATARRIDDRRRELVLEDGSRLGYDRLVVSPGITLRWDDLPGGYDAAAAEIMPHAWRGGDQTRLLHDQLRAMRDGGVVAISVPPPPFRCPPGPYERASLMAHYLKRHKPRSKILILNANTHFSKEDLFREAWQALYGDMIEYRSITEGGLVSAVSPKQGLLHTEGETLRPAVANIIPTQSAGAFALDNGLADHTGWCPVDHRTFESRQLPYVHVLGDSCLAGAMPKSASSANSQAKACALALVALLHGEAPEAPVYHNTCYSLAAPDYGFSVNGMYRYRNGRITQIQRAGGLSPLRAPASARQAEAQHARDWYASINADAFGAAAPSLRAEAGRD